MLKQRAERILAIPHVGEDTKNVIRELLAENEALKSCRLTAIEETERIGELSTTVRTEFVR